MFADRINDFTLAWISILLEGMPFVLLGTLISGMIDGFLPARAVQRWLPRNASIAVPAAGLLGLIMPMCECGIVPVLRRLMSKGVPASAAVTYMLAAPIVNPITFLSTAAAFKNSEPFLFASTRLIYGFVLAVSVGLVLVDLNRRWFLRQQVADDLDRAEEGVLFTSGREVGRPFREKMTGALQCAVSDFIDTSVYLVLGAGIAAFVGTNLDRAMLEPLAADGGTAIAAMMLMAALLCLCSTSDAFVAATFTNFPPSSQLAFLVFGPMIDVKLLVLYSMVFRPQFVALLAVGLAVGTYALCVLYQSQPL